MGFWYEPLSDDELLSGDTRVSELFCVFYEFCEIVKVPLSLYVLLDDIAGWNWGVVLGFGWLTEWMCLNMNVGWDCEFWGFWDRE